MPFNGTQRHRDTEDDDYDYDYDFLSFVLRLSFFVPIIFWSGYALDVRRDEGTKGRGDENVP